MRVFLGWAGDEAKAVALALKEWLPLVCPGLQPWISDDITKGARWSAEIAKTLRQSRAGIFVLTPDNLASVWLHYEAGAISNVEGALVCTILRRVDRAAVKAPLDVFQHTTASDEKDTRQLVANLEALLSKEERQWTETQISAAFKKWWPDLMEKLGKIQPQKGGAAAPRPSADEIMVEVLSTVRELAARDHERAVRQRGQIAFLQDLTAAQQAKTLESLPSSFNEKLARLVLSGMGESGKRGFLSGIAGDASDAEVNAPHDNETAGEGESLLAKRLVEAFEPRMARIGHEGQRKAVEDLPAERPPMPPGAAPAAGKPKRPEMPPERKKR